jgi:X-Pro dipeptidyl-peptidase
MLFSSDSEYTLLPKPGTELTIDLEGTKLMLPIVGGESAFKESIE